MPTPAEIKHLAALALDERAAPVAAYDAIRPGDDDYHPLDWLTGKEPNMAYRPPSMAPRGGYDEDPTDGPQDAAEALEYVGALANALPSGQRAQFLAGLQQLLDSQDAGSAEGNEAALDGSLRHRLAADQRRDRARLAQDSARRQRNHAGFAERYPEAAKISVWGTRT